MKLFDENVALVFTYSGSNSVYEVAQNNLVIFDRESSKDERARRPFLVR